MRNYRLFDPQEMQIIIRRDVVFDEQGIYQPEHVQIELSKEELVIGALALLGKEINLFDTQFSYSQRACI